MDRVRDELIQANAATNSRMDLLDQKVDRVREELMRANAATNSRVDATNSRIDALDQKISRQFTWLVGIQIAILLALIGALLKVAP